MRVAVGLIVAVLALAAVGCSSDKSSPSTSPGLSAPASSSSASGGSGTPAPLTASNSKEFAALLKVGDTCDPSVKAFVTKYAGRESEFDGSVSAAQPHADPYDIRHDYLIAPGDKGGDSITGPAFQFENVSISDLHLTGSRKPDSLKVGDKLHIVAEVDGYKTGCLFELAPVSTQLR